MEEELIDKSLFDNPMAQIHSQSVAYWIGVGKRVGEKIQLHGFELENAKRSASGGVGLMGFNIHAGVFIKGNDREKLQGLCR